MSPEITHMKPETHGPTGPTLTADSDGQSVAGTDIVGH